MPKYPISRGVWTGHYSDSGSEPHYNSIPTSSNLQLLKNVQFLTLKSLSTKNATDNISTNIASGDCAITLAHLYTHRKAYLSKQWPWCSYWLLPRMGEVPGLIPVVHNIFSPHSLPSSVWVRDYRHFYFRNFKFDNRHKRLILPISVRHRNAINLLSLPELFKNNLICKYHEAKPPGTDI